MRINNPEQQRKMISTLQDQLALQTMEATISSGKSAKEIAEHLQSPLSSIYRVIRELEEGGLLVVQKYHLLDDGGRYGVYRSACKRVTVDWSPGNLSVQIWPNEDVVGKFIRFWGGLGAG
jgi:hypothetical protein